MTLRREHAPGETPVREMTLIGYKAKVIHCHLPLGHLMTTPLTLPTEPTCLLKLHHQEKLATRQDFSARHLVLFLPKERAFSFGTTCMVLILEPLMWCKRQHLEASLKTFCGLCKVSRVISG